MLCAGLARVSQTTQNIRSEKHFMPETLIPGLVLTGFRTIRQIRQLNRKINCGRLSLPLSLTR